MSYIPGNAAESVAVQAPEPVDQELVVTVAQVGHVLGKVVGNITVWSSKWWPLCLHPVADLQHVGKHGVGGLGGEDRVLEQDQQRSDIVLPADIDRIKDKILHNMLQN